MTECPNKYKVDSGYNFIIGNISIPSDENLIEGIFDYQTDTIVLLCGHNNIQAIFGFHAKSDCHKLEQIEDIINHEVLHFVLSKVVNGDTSRQMDLVKRKLGLNFDGVTL